MKYNDITVVPVDEKGWTCIFVDDCYCAVDNNTKRIIHSGNGKGKYTPARRAKMCAAVEQWRKTGKVM